MFAIACNTIAAGVKACCKSFEPYAPLANRVKKLADPVLTIGSLTATIGMSRHFEKNNQPILAVVTVLAGVAIVSICTLPDVVILRMRINQRNHPAAPAA